MIPAGTDYFFLSRVSAPGVPVREFYTSVFTGVGERDFIVFSPACAFLDFFFCCFSFVQPGVSLKRIR
jgi:hypothetical protein